LNPYQTNKTPLVSVIIANWNGKSFLDKVIGRLQSQTFTDFEILVVDNGSTDGSIEILKRYEPAVRVERLSTNRGFAAANNIGIYLCQGQWIALLNNDAFPGPDWLEALMTAVNRYPDFRFFASPLLMAQKPGYLDGTGDVYHISGMAWRRDHGQRDTRLPIKPEEVFGPCAAAALYHKESFLQAGGFDEDYFCYHEDVDLSFRLRLLGHRCLHVPRAKVEHYGSGSSGEKSNFVLYQGHRNLIWTFVKNMPQPLFTYYLPFHLLLNLTTILWFSLHGQGWTAIRAVQDALRGLARMKEKRRTIQKQRTVSVSELMQAFDRNWLNPYRDYLLRHRG
jgi:GT2 family glycosyltransferase